MRSASAKRHDTRTWHEEPPPAHVQDPAAAAIFRALRRALAMGLDTERGRPTVIAEIDKRCRVEGTESAE